jgi:hypothetical protein
MYTTPSIADMVEGIIVSLNADILPELQSQKAQTCAIMMQTLLQCIAQLAPVQQQLMAAEHNEMAATLRDVAAIVGESSGAEAERIRQRAQTLGARPDTAPIPSYDEIATDHRELSQGLIETLDDLDGLIRGGNSTGEAALTRLRQHLGPRTVQEYGTFVVGQGMAGRG